MIFVDGFGGDTVCEERAGEAEEEREEMEGEAEERDGVGREREDKVGTGGIVVVGGVVAVERGARNSRTW